MKKYGLFLIGLVLLLSQNTFSQKHTTRIDSLSNVLKHAKTDTAKIGVRGLLAQEFIKVGDSVNAFSYGYRNLRIANKQSDKVYKALANSDVGYLHLKLLHTDSVKFYYNHVLILLSNHTTYKAKRLKIIATNNLAYAYSVEGNMQKALQLVISNLPLIKAVGDSVAYRSTIHNISATFTSSGEYKKAYPYILEDIALVEKGHSEYDNKAETYLSAAFLLLKMDSLQKASYYLDKSKENLVKNVPHNLWGRYYSINAQYLAKVGNIKEARANVDKLFTDIKLNKNGTNTIDAYVAKQEVEWAAKNYKEARQAAFELYNSYTNMEYLLAASLSARDISYLSEYLGDYKNAYTYMSKYAQLNDSIGKQQLVFDLHNLESQYQTSEKEKEILQLQADKKQSQLIQKNQKLLNWLFGIGAMVFLLGLLFLVYVYRNNKYQTEQKLKDIQQQTDLEITQAVLDGEERERQRIARDLHDGLGGALSGIKIKLSGQYKNNQSTALNESIIQLEESIGELRRIARNMMPETLIRSGLEVALKDLCVSLTSPNTQIELQTNGIQKNIALVTQVHVFRIVQELIANAIRHGKASNILIQCIQNQNKLFITVEDNGIGFTIDSNNTFKQKGIGLSNIANRVRFMEGKMDIDTSENNGTTINIEVNV